MASYQSDNDIAFEQNYSHFPMKAQILLKEIENELDTIWAGWRKKQRFDSVDYELKARIKWLLKRHSLLSQSNGPTPTPKYWDVLIVRDSKDKNVCYAHPVIPVDDAPAVTREPVSPLASYGAPKAPQSIVPVAEPVGLPALCKSLRVPLERLETLLLECPSGLSAVQREDWLVEQINPSVKES